MRDRPVRNGKMLSRCGTGSSETERCSPDAGQALGKRFGALPMRDGLSENGNIVLTTKKKKDYD